MKKTFGIISLLILSCSWGYAQRDQYNDNNTDDVYYNNNTNYNEQQGDNDGMSYQTFYDQLSPYGSWVDYPGRGYVWVPQVDGDFVPYQSEGHWVYTDYGWTWASDYQWGWAAFHYGRWFNDPAYGGWMWIPGNDWAPAWVTWGQYEGYYCWAPIGPWEYAGGRAYWDGRPYGDDRYHHWNVVSRDHMGDEHISRYTVSNTVVNHDGAAFERKVQIINNNNTYNRSVFNAGPRAEEVQRATNHPVNKVSISNASKPQATQVHGNEVSIYRPVISKNANQQHAVPSRVVNPTEIPHNNANPSRTDQPSPSPARAAEPQRANPERNNTPARENTSPREQQYNQSWTPPRQSIPQQQRPESPMRQSEPVQQYHQSGGFIPSERPMQQQPMQRSEPMRSAPAPSFHAPSGGGGRHR
jgi:hypothetical protein